MAAVIPTFGFVAKEAGLQGLHRPSRSEGSEPWRSWRSWLGSVFTVAYSVRLFDGIFLRGAPRPDRAGPGHGPAPIDPSRVHRPSRGFVAAPALLAVLSVVFGLAAARVGDVHRRGRAARSTRRRGRSTSCCGRGGVRRWRSRWPRGSSGRRSPRSSTAGPGVADPQPVVASRVYAVVLRRPARRARSG